MRTLLKVFICGAAAAAGYALALFLALFLLDLAGVAAFEGEQATLAAFIVGPIGALGGLWAGGWAAQRAFHEPTAFGGVVRIVAATLVLTSVLAALGVLVSVLFSGGGRYTNTAPPKLNFEIRMPSNAVADADQRQWRVNLDTPDNQMPATLARPFSTEGENVILSGEVELYYKTRQRILALDLGDGRSIPIQLSLPAAPPASTDWSPWAKAGGALVQVEFRTRLTVY